MTNLGIADSPLVEGEAPGIDELLSRFGPPALALAWRVIGDHGLAEDVVQETFLDYWRRPAAFDPARGSLAGWLLAMVHHKAVDAIRRQESRRRVIDRLIDGHIPSEGEAPEALVDQRLLGATVRAALQHLSAVQREAIVLAYWGGYTQVEIAALTATPLGTVKTRVASGMRLLAAALRAR